MPNIIFLLLMATGIISILSLLWFTVRLIDLYVGPKERRIKTRIANLGSESHGYISPMSDLNDKDITRFEIIANIQESRLVKWLDLQISKSGIAIGTHNFIVVSFLLFICSLLLTYITTYSYSWALLVGSIASIFPYLVLKILILRRQALLERELPDLLDFMARSLQVGHSFNSTLQMAANEAPLPLSIEFKRIFDELNFGAPIQKVLSELSNRIECAEIRYFVIAVIVNREIGGDLAEILKRVSRLIRDRMEFHQVIRVLSSEGKASAFILGALPFLVGGLIFSINPESLSLMLSDSFGRDLLLYAGLLMTLGFFWMNRICVVRA